LKKRYYILFSVFSVLFLSPVRFEPTDEAATGEDINEAVSPSVTLWYVSNEMGQALRNAYSFTALREKYALSVMTVAGAFVPDEFRADYDAGWKTECRSLYEDGELLRTQWVFIDENGVTRFVSAKSPEGAGFTESYNERGLLMRESRFDAPVDASVAAPVAAPTEEGNEEGEPAVTEVPPLVITYSYREDFLTGAQSDEWADVYRYARNNQIRVIERTYLETKAQTRVTLPRTIKDLSFNETNGAFFVSPVTSYSSAFLQDVLLNTGTNTVYTLDDKGRILTETRHDAEGEISGTLTNVWDENRIRSVVWESEGDTRRVDYAFDEDGERVNEKNYRNGTLEREVVVSGGEEIETLFLRGEAVLRAVWQDGRKIEEKSLRVTEHAPVSRRRSS
jgi:hypothetical protein